MLRKILPAIFLLCYTTVATADQPAHSLLKRMNHAARTLNYEGIFVYEHGNQLEAMRIVHLYSNGQVRERLLSLNGAAREIIRDDKEVRCYLPDKQSVVVEHRKTVDKGFPPVFTQNIELLDQNYMIKMGRPGRVADRLTESVLIKPRDKFRYGYQLWADKKSGLLLKANLLDSNNKTIEQFMFTQVAIGKAIHPSQVEAHTRDENLVWHRENGGPAQSISSNRVWHASHLPRGFTLSTRLTRKVPTRKIPVEHLVYSDGLAAVSVFIEKIHQNGAPAMHGPSRMGAVHAYGNVVNNHQITVVGEVPAITVSLIGSSVTVR